MPLPPTFPHPCSPFGFHVFALSPALCPGFSFCSLFPLLSSPLCPPLCSSPPFWRMDSYPGSTFSCLSYLFTLLSEHTCPRCWLYPPWAPAPYSNGLYNFSSYTSHESPKTLFGQNWIYHWFWLQTDLISLVFPHFCQRYWGIITNHQSFGVRFCHILLLYPPWVLCAEWVHLCPFAVLTHIRAWNLSTSDIVCGQYI